MPPVIIKRRSKVGLSYVGFRPGLELENELRRVAASLRTSMSEVVRMCCEKAIPSLGRRA